MGSKLTFGERVTGTAVLLATCGLLFGPAVLCWQSLQWLKTGIWPPIPVARALEYLQLPHPDLEWRGVQKIVDYVLDVPLSLASFILTMVLFIGAVLIMEEYERRRV